MLDSASFPWKSSSPDRLGRVRGSAESFSSLWHSWLIPAAAGFLYGNASEVRDRRFNPIEGQLVDVGGGKMHIHCTGNGSPTVILDSGLGDSYLSWRKVQPQIAKFTRVCSYDRVRPRLQ